LVWVKQFLILEEKKWMTYSRQICVCWLESQRNRSDCIARRSTARIGIIEFQKEVIGFL
jgi:hypothetical protein